MRSALFLARSVGSNRGLATVSTCSCSQRASWRAGENRHREFESGSLRQDAFGRHSLASPRGLCKLALRPVLGALKAFASVMFERSTSGGEIEMEIVNNGRKVLGGTAAWPLRT